MNACMCTCVCFALIGGAWECAGPELNVQPLSSSMRFTTLVFVCLCVFVCVCLCMCVRVFLCVLVYVYVFVCLFVRRYSSNKNSTWRLSNNTHARTRFYFVGENALTCSFAYPLIFIIYFYVNSQIQDGGVLVYDTVTGNLITRYDVSAGNYLARIPPV